MDVSVLSVLCRNKILYTVNQLTRALVTTRYIPRYIGIYIVIVFPSVTVHHLYYNNVVFTGLFYSMFLPILLKP